MSRFSRRDRSGEEHLEALEARVGALEEAVEDCRRLNERLSDVLDVVVELLVPAADRDDERLRAALEKLGQIV